MYILYVYIYDDDDSGGFFMMVMVQDGVPKITFIFFKSNQNVTLMTKRIHPSIIFEDSIVEVGCPYPPLVYALIIQLVYRQYTQYISF